jgi:hypothetical protein
MKTTLSQIEEQFPVLKIYHIGTTYYVYDGRSGMLAETDLHEIDSIYQYYFQQRNANISAYLKNLLGNGVFLPGKLERITPDENQWADIINYQIDGNIPRSLILEITEKCNLSCSYCFFSKEGFSLGQCQYIYKSTISGYCYIIWSDIMSFFWRMFGFTNFHKKVF